MKKLHNDITSNQLSTKNHKNDITWESNYKQMKSVYTTYYSISLVLILILASCTKVIDVSVPNGGERLVIEASIVWEKGTSGKSQTIKLSKSTEYFASDRDIAATGAIVKVTNTTSNDVFNFIDQGDGTYTTNNFIPILNNQYELEIQYNGNTYNATETFTSVAEVTRVEQKKITGFDGDQISVLAYFKDPGSIKNYYLAAFTTSSQPLINLETTNDEFYDGNENFIEYDGETLKIGDTVLISLHGVSENYYNYMEILTAQLGDGGPFQTVPARLKGNCINKNNLNEEVLGFFRLSEESKISYTVN